MIDRLKELDETFFLYLNGIHSSWMDPVMLTLTGRYIWIPLYLFLIYLLIRTYGRESAWYIVGLAVVILFADQFTSGFMKPYFERLRPCHDERWDDVILNYSGCGGLYGFASSHAANTFALACYLNLVAAKKIGGFRWLYLWAAVVSYTRIYLGVHYPLDVLIGALVGMLLAWLIWIIIINLKNQLGTKKKVFNQ